MRPNAALFIHILESGNWMVFVFFKISFQGTNAKKGQAQLFAKNLDPPFSLLIRVLCTGLPGDISIITLPPILTAPIPPSPSHSNSHNMVMMMVFCFSWFFMRICFTVPSDMWRWVIPIKWVFLSFANLQFSLKAACIPPLRYASGWQRWNFFPNLS